MKTLAYVKLELHCECGTITEQEVEIGEKEFLKCSKCSSGNYVTLTQMSQGSLEDEFAEIVRKG